MTKLCYFIMKCTVIICVVFLHRLQRTDAEKDHCNGQPFQDVAHWNFGAESERPVRNVSQSLLAPVENKQNLEVRLVGIRENFDVGLLAIPYINDLSKCPINITGNLNLRQHDCVFNITVDPKLPVVAAGLRNIFSGCYYVAIRNDRGKIWVAGPAFHNTRFHYIDTKLNISSTQISPEDETASKEIKILLEVPLSCIEVRASLYELPKPVNVTIDVIRNQMIDEEFPYTQRCIISNVGKNGHQSECWLSSLTTSVEVEVTNTVNKTNDGWSAVISWKKLLRGGHTYYLLFTPMTSGCYPGDDTLHDDFTSWDLVDKHLFIDLENVIASNIPNYKKPFNWIPIASALMGIVVIAIVAFWIYKFLKLLNTPYPRINQLEKSLENIELNEYESEHILLIYVPSCPLFMETMNSFRDRLEQDCHCHVHDLYAASEWNTIRELGADGWVEKLLRDGSRVVWVDTPQFRSRLNDEEIHRTVGDFRDNAVPYAVAMATDLFQNATTQYRRHFVVRVKGFEVDDLQDDPLLVVSPHARYHIPENLSLLCEHLRGPVKNFETRTNDE